MDTMNQMGGNMPGNMGGMEPAKKSYGALIAVIVILVLMVIGGLYFLGQRMSNKPYGVDNSGTSDPITESMQNQSSSDDTASIQADLNATNLDSLDQGSASVESQMSSQ